MLWDLWWHCLTVLPGGALAGFAFAVAVLIVRADLAPPWEKTIWVVLAALLLATELNVCYQNHVEAGSFLVFHPQGQDAAVVDTHGSSTLHSASMFVADLDQFNLLQNAHIEDSARYQRVVQTVPLGDFQPGTRTTFALRPIGSGLGVTHYRITFTANNNLWWEDLQTASIAGHTSTAYRILRYRWFKPAVLLERDDPDFPRGEQGSIDWTWATRQP